MYQPQQQTALADIRRLAREIRAEQREACRSVVLSDLARQFNRATLAAESLGLTPSDMQAYDRAQT